MSETKSARRLRTLIRANGLFSIVSGLILAGGSPLLDTVVGVSPGWLVAVGLPLVGYGVSLYLSAGREETLGRIGRLATAADIGWVLAAAAIIALTDVLTRNGEIALAAVSVVVLGFAVSQGRALRAPQRPEAATS